MGLFRKKVKETKNQNEVKTEVPLANQENPTDVEVLNLGEENKDVEILDLSKEPKEIENTLKTRNENRLIFVIVIGLIIFALFLPTIAGWFKNNNILTIITGEDEIKNTNTVNGLLEIGKETGSITAKKIQYYNFNKRSNNQISAVYLPETEIKDVNSLNIYIELYNSNKGIIYRTKFTSDKKLERKVQGTYSLTLNETIYNEATYAKIVIMDENSWGDASDTLVCIQNFTDEEYGVEYKITYHFSEVGLLNYVVNKKAVASSTDDENNTTCLDGTCETDTPTEETEDVTSTNKYANSFAKEAEEISKTNTEDLFYDSESLSYTIDLMTLDLKTSDYQVLHELGSLKRQVELNEEKNGWMCE